MKYVCMTWLIIMNGFFVYWMCESEHHIQHIQISSNSRRFLFACFMKWFVFYCFLAHSKESECSRLVISDKRKLNSYYFSDWIIAKSLHMGLPLNDSYQFLITFRLTFNLNVAKKEVNIDNYICLSCVSQNKMFTCSKRRPHSETFFYWIHWLTLI